MSEQTAVGKREVWVDDVKVIACSMCRCSLSVAGIFTRSTARWTVSRVGRKTC